MNRVLFHSLTIPPDQVSTGKLVADIASIFDDMGSATQRNQSILTEIENLAETQVAQRIAQYGANNGICLLYTSPSPRD